MVKRKWTATLMGLVGLAIGVASVVASAAGEDDRAVAEAAVAELKADGAHAALTRDLLKKAEDALKRGRGMRAAGDEAHARIADGVAREWAESARDLVRAADAERKAADARRDALDAGAQSERERALLEEGLARTGRLRSQIEQAEREAKTTNRTAAAAMDGGATSAPKPKRPRDDNHDNPRGAP